MPKSKRANSPAVPSGLPAREIFRRNLAIELRKQGASYRELAEKAWLSPHTITAIMQGRHRAAPATQAAIAHAFGVTVESMLIPPAPGAYEGLFGTSPEYDSA